jgi:hypothetical protein
MKGHEVLDANWMASVGVDYLKVDDMSGAPHTEAGAYVHAPPLLHTPKRCSSPPLVSFCQPFLHLATPDHLHLQLATVGHPWHFSLPTQRPLTNARRSLFRYADYATIRDALNKTGRPIFFSTCGHSGDSGGHNAAYPWVGAKCAELANACRIASDVRQWGPGTFGTNKAVNVMAAYQGNFSRSGSWPDPDLVYSFLPVGPAGTNTVCKGAGVLEYCTGSFCDPVRSHSVTQFALWAIMGAPLLLSFDVRAVSADDLAHVYGNPEIIAISQVSGA